MKSFTLSILMIVVFSLENLYAQTTVIDQANQVVKTGQALKDIFGKKKTANTTSEPATSNSSGTSQANRGNSTNNNGLKAGDIAPNAKYLDIDEMLYFSDGAAWVKKGSSTALIDSAARLIVPFNKYQIFQTGLGPQGAGGKGYHHGMFAATEISTKRKGYLNSKGVFFPASDQALTYMCSEYMVIQNGNSFTYVDNDWHTFTMTKPVDNFREGIGVSYQAERRNYGTKLGYKKINNQFVINPQWEAAESFWDGRAIVGKINEFGEMKYGFIDKTGREIFPCVLSNKPGHFSSGLALIEPKDKSEFDYAYINREGQVVIKMKNSEGLFSNFYHGYASGLGNKIMDSTGKIMTGGAFLQKFAIAPDAEFFMPIENVYYYQYCDDILSDKINFNAWVKGSDKSRKYAGYFDIKTKKVVYAIFEPLDEEKIIRFDKVARLSYAKMVIGYDKEHRQDIFREGFINEDGLFVIVKGQQSAW